MRNSRSQNIVRQDLLLREPTAEDAPAIRAIDTEGLASGHATFRAESHDWRSFSAAFRAGTGLALVAEGPDGVIGWAGVSPISARHVYAGVGEVSVYIAGRVRGRGVGQALLADLVEASEAAGYWTLVAQIFPENIASLSLHRACGFHVVGTRERLGLMSYGPRMGQWRDVVMLERRSDRIGVPGL